jgi:hypothetical protein
MRTHLRNFFRCRHSLAPIGLFFGLKPWQTRATHLNKQRICATWLMHNFSCPKLYLGLLFFAARPSLATISIPKCNLGTRRNGAYPEPQCSHFLWVVKGQPTW